MSQEFDERVRYDESFELAIECPICGDPYLHHGSVDVFSRERDDGPVTRVLVENGAITRGGKLEENPSSRRGGIRIHMRCENCGDLPCSLAIAQHKGQTMLLWSEA